MIGCSEPHRSPTAAGGCKAHAQAYVGPESHGKCMYMTWAHPSARSGENRGRRSRWMSTAKAEAGAGKKLAVVERVCSLPSRPPSTGQTSGPGILPPRSTFFSLFLTRPFYSPPLSNNFTLFRLLAGRTHRALRLTTPRTSNPLEIKTAPARKSIDTHSSTRPFVSTPILRF